MSTKKRVIISILVVLIVALLAVLAYFYHTVSSVANIKTIGEGISIDGCDVSGLKKQEAYDKVVDYEDALYSKEITLTYEDHEDSMTLESLGLSYEDPEDAVEKAYELGKQGSMLKRYKAIRAGEGKGTDFSIKKQIDKEAFQEYIDANADHFGKVAANATITRENGSFVITDEQKGIEVPVDSNVKAIDALLNKNWNKKDLTYALEADVAEPEYTREDMEKIKDVLGTYTTSFATSTAERIKNITNACSKINGSVVYPGETFSVMDLIAPLNAENGYEKAGSYSAGEVIQSYGGGVCQVSTTLYNAVLLSELDVVERHNHQMTVSYVDVSFDAAVSDSGGQDFKFTNNYEVPVYIAGAVNGYNVTFTVYGAETRAENRSIEYYSEKTQTINPGKDIVTKDKNLEEGKEIVTQKPHVGYRAKLWKRVLVDGVEQSTSEVNNSYYAASPKRVTVGTKEKKASADAEKKDEKKNSKKNADKTTATTEQKAEKATQNKAEATEAVVTTQAPAAQDTTEVTQ